MRSTAVISAVHGQPCGTIGASSEEELTASRNHGLYLNTQDPAPCNGTVDRFRYCFYNTLQSASLYQFTFAVFRETSNSYRAVSKAFTTGRTLSDRGSQTFSCITYEVKPIEIQAGDIVGACIFDPPDENGRNVIQLDVVGDSDDEDNFLMSTGNSGCDNSAIPSTVSKNSLNMRESIVLHIHADISKLLMNTIHGIKFTLINFSPS